MEKRCLIIDNEDQGSNIETIERLGRSKGVKILCDEFNIGVPRGTDVITNSRIDITKVIEIYKSNFKKYTYHIVALDWDLGDDPITGVELIRKFQENKILINTPKILYSGLLKDEISSALEDYKTNLKSKTDLMNWLNTLIRVDVRNFVDRVSYEQEIVTQLVKIDETLDLIIENELNKFPELVFMNSFGSESFRGKTYREIAKALENNFHLRSAFKKEIVAQVLAYLTEKIGK